MHDNQHTYSVDKVKEQTMSKDTIYREDAIKALYKYGFVSKDVIEREIKAIPSADRPQEWIPCSERLPKVRTDVLLQFKDNMCVGFLSHGDWNINSGGGYYTGVTQSEEQPVAWMPLPQPYEETDHE